MERVLAVTTCPQKPGRKEEWCPPRSSMHFWIRSEIKVWNEEDNPKDWKVGLLVKLPKKGDLCLCKNWRGIMLLAVASKVLCKIILKRMKEALDGRLWNERALMKCFVIPHNSKLEKKLRRNRLFDASWFINLPRFQEARPDHVRVESSCFCFPRELRVLTLGTWHIFLQSENVFEVAGGTTIYDVNLTSRKPYTMTYEKQTIIWTQYPYSRAHLVKVTSDTNGG